MKTTIFTILALLLTSLTVNSQNFECFDKNIKLDWTKWEDKEVTEDLIRSNFHSIQDNPYQEIEYAIQNIDKFYLLDLIGDNNLELVYNGWNGGEGEMVVIYELNDGKYYEKQRFIGRICDIKNVKTEMLSLIVLDYSCCAGYIDHVETFKFNNVSETFEIIHSIAKNIETKIPDNWIDPIRFIVVNSPYYLRFSPQVLTGLKVGYFDFEPILGQNITASYNTGDTGTAYATSTDSTGRVWWFVVMDTKNESDSFLYYNANNNFNDYKPIGWMSSRYLEKIE